MICDYCEVVQSSEEEVALFMAQETTRHSSFCTSEKSRPSLFYPPVRTVFGQLLEKEAKNAGISVVSLEGSK
jgi:hypothetical protein